MMNTLVICIPDADTPLAADGCKALSSVSLEFVFVRRLPLEVVVVVVLVLTGDWIITLFISTL